jgi:hypothetical protein
MHCLGRTLLWAIFLLPATSVAPVLADECETKAAEIAGRIGLDAGARTKANFIPLSARTDEDDDYGAYLNCVGPHGMSLRYVSPPNPSQKWFEFVGRTSAILTGIKATRIATEARSCVDTARSHDGYSESPSPAFMLCDADKDMRAEILIGER